MKHFLYGIILHFTLFFHFLEKSNCQLFDYLNKESDQEKQKIINRLPRFEEEKPMKTQFIDTLLSQAHSMISNRNKDLEEKKVGLLMKSLQKGKRINAANIRTEKARIPYLKVTHSLVFQKKAKVKIGGLEISLPELQMILLMSSRLLKACGKNIENCLIKDNDIDELTLNRKDLAEERETMRYLKKSAMKDLNEYDDLDEELNGALHPKDRKGINNVSIEDFEDSLNF